MPSNLFKGNDLSYDIPFHESKSPCGPASPPLRTVLNLFHAPHYPRARAHTHTHTHTADPLLPQVCAGAPSARQCMTQTCPSPTSRAICGGPCSSPTKKSSTPARPHTRRKEWFSAARMPWQCGRMPAFPSHTPTWLRPRLCTIPPPRRGWLTCSVVCTGVRRSLEVRRWSSYYGITLYLSVIHPEMRRSHPVPRSRSRSNPRGWLCLLAQFTLTRPSFGGWILLPAV